MIDGRIDYSKYSRADLLSAVTSIDKDRYPQNYANLLQALALEPGVTATPSTDKTGSVAAVTLAAIEALRSNPRRLCRLIALPTLLEIPGMVIPPGLNLVYVGSITIGILSGFVVAVRVHRYILLPPGLREPASAHEYLRFGTWCLLLALPLIAWLVPVFAASLSPAIMASRSLTVSLWFLLGFVATPYVWSRLSLGLPNRAVGQAASISNVWSWSKGRGWWLTGAIVLPSVLMYAATSLGAWPMPQGIRGYLVAIVSVVWVPFQVALLSCSYRVLRPIHLGTPS